jgi:hypothetical protein
MKNYPRPARGSLPLQTNRPEPTGFRVILLLLLFSLTIPAFALDGSGVITIDTAPNLGPARVGTVTITGCASTPCQSGEAPITQTFTVIQASGCAWRLAATSIQFVISGGQGFVGVTPTDPACAWFASSNATWIAIAPVTASAVNFTVGKNNGNPARSGTLTIAGQTFTVNQAGHK